MILNMGRDDLPSSDEQRSLKLIIRTPPPGVPKPQSSATTERCFHTKKTETTPSPKYTLFSFRSRPGAQQRAQAQRAVAPGTKEKNPWQTAALMQAEKRVSILKDKGPSEHQRKKGWQHEGTVAGSFLSEKVEEIRASVLPR